MLKHTNPLYFFFQNLDFFACIAHNGINESKYNFFIRCPHIVRQRISLFIEKVCSLFNRNFAQELLFPLCQIYLTKKHY